MFFSGHSLETWNHKIVMFWQMCIHPLMSLFMQGMPSVKMEGEGDTPRNEGEWKPLFILFGNNHRAELVPAVRARWCPSPIVPCLFNREERDISRVACGTGKCSLMWMMCHINTNHSRVSPTAKLDPQNSSTSTHSQSSPCLAVCLRHYQRWSIDEILNANLRFYSPLIMGINL